jgi:hypothetical protein
VLLTRLFVISTCAFLVSCGGGDGPPDDDGDGRPNSADCAPGDPLAWQRLAYRSRDADGDTFQVDASGFMCSGDALPSGYYADATQGPNLDCDDGDRSRFTTRTFASRDRDADSHRINESGSICAGAALPATYFADLVAANEVDCDDDDPGLWANRAFASYDGDNDSHGVSLAGSMCVGAALPEHYSADSVAANDADCDDADPGRWITVNYRGRDRDEDGHPVDEPGQLCLAAAALPATYAAQVPALLRDCDDDNAAHWRLASVYRDQDGDGVGAGPREIQCLGSVPAAGFSLQGYDPNDLATDPAAAQIAEIDLPPTLKAPPEDADDEDIF